MFVPRSYLENLGENVLTWPTAEYISTRNRLMQLLMLLLVVGATAIESL